MGGKPLSLSLSGTGHRDITLKTIEVTDANPSSLETPLNRWLLSAVRVISWNFALTRIGRRSLRRRQSMQNR